MKLNRIFAPAGPVRCLDVIYRTRKFCPLFSRSASKRIRPRLLMYHKRSVIDSLSIFRFAFRSLKDWSVWQIHSVVGLWIIGSVEVNKSTKLKRVIYKKQWHIMTLTKNIHEYGSNAMNKKTNVSPGILQWLCAQNWFSDMEWYICSTCILTRRKTIKIWLWIQLYSR